MSHPSFPSASDYDPQREIAKRLAQLEPKKRKWRGTKRKRVLAYLLGILKRSRQFWTWVNPRTIAASLSKNSEDTISEKTVWRVIKDIADREQTPDQDPEFCVRMSQRQTHTNWHFQWMIAYRAQLTFDKEPLFYRRDGKSRNLRTRCRKKNLPSTRTNPLVLVQQQKREPTPPGENPPIKKPDNTWKHLVPGMEQMFHRLGLPTYVQDKSIWSHSPYKRQEDKTPSCLIFPLEGRFWDFSTGQGGNAVTLARIANANPQMPFQEALRWLEKLPPCSSVPSPWHTPAASVEPLSGFQIFLKTHIEGRADEIPPTPPRPEGLYRLAWHIYRKTFKDVQIPCVNPKGIVTSIVKALKRKAECAAIEEAIQAAIMTWKIDQESILFRCERTVDDLRTKKWRNKILRGARYPEEFAMVLGVAQFIKELKRRLERSVLPAQSSPPVPRNQDRSAITMCQAQIRAMFRAKDSVWITNNLTHRGWCRSAEYWLNDIAKHGVPTGPNGAWLKINPMLQCGIGSGDVLAFRHVLCEADALSIEDQMELAEKLPYPVVSAVHSLSLIHLTEPTRRDWLSRMPSSA